jgi:hypothetical protein
LSSSILCQNLPARHKTPSPIAHLQFHFAQIYRFDGRAYATSLYFFAGPQYYVSTGSPTLEALSKYATLHLRDFGMTHWCAISPVADEIAGASLKIRLAASRSVTLRIQRISL